MLPKFSAVTRISEFAAQQKELMGQMNPTSYGPIKPHSWLVCKICPKTWENRKETSEKNTLTTS